MIAARFWQPRPRMSEITVLIASKSSSSRAKLEEQLAGNRRIRIVGDAAEDSEIRAMTTLHYPDVLVLHISSLGEPQQELLKQLHHIHPFLKILALECSPEHVRTSFIQLSAWGLRGCICHWKNSGELVEAIHTIMDGEFYLCPVASHALVDAYRHMIHRPVREKA